MEPMIGQIILFGGNFAPRGCAFCEGQLLPITAHSALFSILGTVYGGDGRTSFGLPDLRGRVPMHAGTGPGLSPRRARERTGAEAVTLSRAQMPAHGHDLNVVTDPADQGHPPGAMLAASRIYATTTAPVAALHPAAIARSGDGQAHDNMQPTLCINYIIALEGIFPSRN